MTTVQPQAAPVLFTKNVLYKDQGSGAEIKVGYNVCYDLSIASTSSTWDDYVAGRVVTKPVTANLHNYAGVVVALGQRTAPDSATDQSRWVTIAIPMKGETVMAYTHANMTVGATVLACANGDWGLVAQTLTAEQIETDTVAIAAETANTSSTAANKLVRFL